MRFLNPCPPPLCFAKRAIGTGHDVLSSGHGGWRASCIAGGAPLFVGVVDGMLHYLLQILPRLVEDQPAEVREAQPPGVALQGAATRVHDWAAAHALLRFPVVAEQVTSPSCTVDEPRSPSIGPTCATARQLRCEATWRHGQAPTRPQHPACLPQRNFNVSLVTNQAPVDACCH